MTFPADEAPTSPDGPPPDPALTVLRRVGLVGVGLGFLLAVVVGLIGGSGRDGAAVLLLLLALTSALLGAVGVATMARDDHRGQPISRTRVVVTVAGFAGATLLMAMLTGIGG